MIKYYDVIANKTIMSGQSLSSWEKDVIERFKDLIILIANNESNNNIFEKISYVKHDKDIEVGDKISWTQDLYSHNAEEPSGIVVEIHNNLIINGYIPITAEYFDEDGKTNEDVLFVTQEEIK